MIAYFDASALVKCYVAEANSTDTMDLLTAAEQVASSLVTRAEVVSALAKAERRELLSSMHALKAQRQFVRDWHDLVRIPVTEAIVARAEGLAWDRALRGYDAVQLASALSWQEAMDADVAFATFDRQLWEAGRQTGLTPWPAQLRL